MRPHIFREHRKALGLTQQQLADALGMEKRQIGRYESGRIVPPARTVKLFEMLIERGSAK